MNKNLFRPPTVSQASLRDQEIIDRANADNVASPVKPRKKLLNLALDVRTDELLHRLAILDRGKLLDTFALAVEQAAGDVSGFAAFARDYSGSSSGQVVSKAFWLPEEVIDALSGLPAALQEHDLLVQSKSRIARLVLMYAGHRRGLDIQGRRS